MQKGQLSQEGQAIIQPIAPRLATLQHYESCLITDPTRPIDKVRSQLYRWLALTKQSRQFRITYENPTTLRITRRSFEPPRIESCTKGALYATALLEQLIETDATAEAAETTIGTAFTSGFLTSDEAIELLSKFEIITGQVPESRLLALSCGEVGVPPFNEAVANQTHSVRLTNKPSTITEEETN